MSEGFNLVAVTITKRLKKNELDNFFLTYSLLFEFIYFIRRLFDVQKNGGDIIWLLTFQKFFFF